MRCTKCGTTFRFSVWIMQCGECKEQYCTKCMKRMNGICYCEKCVILITRPPDINELMKLKSKDLQAYLKRHNIPTLGLVEKRELVELLCNRTIPVKNTKTSAVFNKIFSNFESVFLEDKTSPTREPAQFEPPGSRHQSPPLPPRPHHPPYQFHPSTSTCDLSFADHTEYGPGQSRNAHTLPKAPPPRPPPPNLPSPRSVSSPTSPTVLTPPMTIPTPIHTVSSPTVTVAASSSDISTTTSSAPPQQPPPPPPPIVTMAASPTTTHAQSTPTLNTLDRPSFRLPKLSDYHSVEDLSNLSAKELKILLTFNRVDYRGCVEKSELVEKAEILWNDNKKQRYDELPANIEDLCKLCMDAPLDCVLLECGHIATCVNCGKKLAECPICRQYVTRVVRTFKA